MMAFRLLTATDLHSRPEYFIALEEAVRRHKPHAVALVGDFLDGLPSSRGLLSPSEVALMLGRLDTDRLLIVRGNHEHDNWLGFRQAWNSRRPVLEPLHAMATAAGPMSCVGFPCLMGDETAFVSTLMAGGDARPGLADLEFSSRPELWFAKDFGGSTNPRNQIWLMHEPPTGTPLTRSSGLVVGNGLWERLVRHHQPRLVIGGHDHTTPSRVRQWHAALGRTTVVNLGQSDSGPFHHLLVNVTSDQAGAATVHLTAYPWHQELVLKD